MLPHIFLIILWINIVGSSRHEYIFVRFPHGKALPADAKGNFVTGNFSSERIRKPDRVQLAAMRDGFYLPSTLPTDFHFHILSSKQALSCLVNKTVRIAGDSYMVEVFIALVDILIGKPSNAIIKDAGQRTRALDSATNAVNRMRSDNISIDVAYVFPRCRHGRVDCLIDHISKMSGRVDAFLSNILIHHIFPTSTRIFSEDGLQNIERGPDYIRKLMQLFELAKKMSVPLTWATGPR